MLFTTDQNKLPEFAPSLRHAVRLQRVLLSTLSHDHSENKRQLRAALDGTFLVKFMSSVAANKFEVRSFIHVIYISVLTDHTILCKDGDADCGVGVFSASCAILRRLE